MNIKYESNKGLEKSALRNQIIESIDYVDFLHKGHLLVGDSKLMPESLRNITVFYDPTKYKTVDDELSVGLRAVAFDNTTVSLVYSSLNYYHDIYTITLGSSKQGVTKLEDRISELLKSHSYLDKEGYPDGRADLVMKKVLTRESFFYVFQRLHAERNIALGMTNLLLEEDLR